MLWLTKRCATNLCFVARGVVSCSCSVRGRVSRAATLGSLLDFALRYRLSLL